MQPTGSAPLKVDCPYYDNLQFLIPMIENRQPLSSKQFQSSSTDTSALWTNNVTTNAQSHYNTATSTFPLQLPNTFLPVQQPFNPNIPSYSATTAYQEGNFNRNTSFNTQLTASNLPLPFQEAKNVPWSAVAQSTSSSSQTGIPNRRLSMQQPSNNDLQNVPSCNSTTTYHEPSLNRNTSIDNQLTASN